MTKSEQQGKISFYILALLLAVVLCFWVVTESQIQMNTDNAFLANAAIKMLTGEKMSETYYDTNPPLSVIIYLPAAMLVKFCAVPVYYAVFIYGIVLLALSLVATYVILEKMDRFSGFEKQAILYSALLANTFGVAYYFTERDQIIALALLPMFLLQLAMTDRVPFKPLFKWAVLLMTGFLILLKPHYGLIPVVMISHRAIKQKRFSALFDADFWALCIACTTYLVLLYVFFYDFLSIILPDVITMYAMTQDTITVPKAVIQYGASLTLIAAMSCLTFDKPYKNTLIFCIPAALCMLIFYLQGKGFLYQLIPFLTFLTAGFTLFLTKFIHELIFKGAGKTSQNVTLMIIIALLAVAFDAGMKTPIPRLTHAQYQNDPLTKRIKACGKESCPFFIFNDRNEMMHELAVYSGQPLASRFSAFFFLPYLLPSVEVYTPEEKSRLIKKYTTMIAEDFERYQPETLLIGRFKVVRHAGYFDFMAFFKSQSERLQKDLNRYKKIDTITVDQNKYTGGALNSAKKLDFDIYVKKTADELSSDE